VDHAGVSSPVATQRRHTESPDSAKIAPVRNATAENAPEPQTDVRISFAHSTCAVLGCALYSAVRENPQQFCGDSAPSAITSGTEGARSKVIP
jgi:hypothetical protein